MGRPRHVENAVMLLYVSLGIGGLTGYLQGEIFSSIVAVVVAWYINHKIYIGRNWARITLLVLYVPVALISVAMLPFLLTTSPLFGLIAVVQLFVQGTALVLLFTKLSSEWFIQIE